MYTGTQSSGPNRPGKGHLSWEAYLPLSPDHRVITGALEGTRAQREHLPGAGSLAVSCVCQGALGIRSPQVFHLLLDMLDEEKNQSVKKTVSHSRTPLPLLNPSSKSLLPNRSCSVRREERRMSPQTLSLDPVPWGHSGMWPEPPLPWVSTLLPA